MTRIRPAPTLTDVAALANVSTATVSRCLNLPAQVSETTRARVLAAVDALGYSPNFGARAMAAQRTDTIGAIIPTMDNAVFARGIQALQETLDAEGFTLLIATSGYRPDLEARQIRTMVTRGADALLLIGHDRDPACYRLPDARGVPVLVAWAHDRARPRPSIGFDNRAAMARLAAEVLRLGHRRLALISAPLRGNDRAEARLAGIRDAMRVAGLPPAALEVLETPYAIANGAGAFDALMRRRPRPTAVLCGNDVLAVGAIDRARVLGLSVPGDVSITGFDDLELAQAAFPRLTTVQVPHAGMGRGAGLALIARLRHGTPLVSVELPAEVRMRESLGPAPPEPRGSAAGARPGAGS